jgi:hypothetical protein
MNIFGSVVLDIRFQQKLGGCAIEIVICLMSSTIFLASPPSMRYNLSRVVSKIESLCITAHE